MNHRKLSETPILPGKSNIDARNLYDSPEVVITALRLKTGQSLTKHITPVDVSFYVLQGTGIVLVGDEKEEVGPNTLIESPKGIVHCWYNESQEDLLILIIKAPRPTTKTVFMEG